MKKKNLFGNQSLTRFTAEIFAKSLQYILQMFFVAKNRNFYMYCEQMVGCCYSQVEIVLLKKFFCVLEYFSNIQVKFISLC